MAKILDIKSSVTPQNVTPIHVSKTTKEAAKEKLNELIREETKMVKGIFQHFETPGGSVKVTVRKYPGIPHFEKTMTDGEIYDIPLYVARHLNGIDASAGALGDPDKKNASIGTCSYPVHGFVMKSNELNPSGLGAVEGMGGIPVPMVGVTKRVKRFGFQSLEFASGF